MCTAHCAGTLRLAIFVERKGLGQLWSALDDLVSKYLGFDGSFEDL